MIGLGVGPGGSGGRFPFSKWRSSFKEYRPRITTMILRAAIEAMSLTTGVASRLAVRNLRRQRLEDKNQRKHNTKTFLLSNMRGSKV